MKKSKIIVLLLAILTMTVALTGCGKESYSEGLEFRPNNDGGYYVAGIGTCTDTKINIPPTYEDLPVTSIGGNAFEDCTDLKSIKIPESVTNIGRYAFTGCTSLKTVTFPESELFINQYAFCACTSLKDLKIPASATHIGEGVFYMCTSLTNIQFGGTVDEWENIASNQQAAEFNCTVTCTDGTVEIVS